MLLIPALAISAVLFTLGVAGVLLRRNAIVLFMCVELMLNAVNLTFVALAQPLGMGGQVFVFFVMAVAAPHPWVGARVFSPLICRSAHGRARRLPVLVLDSGRQSPSQCGLPG